MQSKEAVLNIAVNLGRVARYLEKNNIKRAQLFLKDNDQYIPYVNLDMLTPNVRKSFEKAISLSKQAQEKTDLNLSEDFYTYANILTHRAHLFV